MSHLLKRLKELTNKQRFIILLVSIAILIALVSLLILKNPAIPTAGPAREVVTYSTDEPGEDKPENYVWKGLPTDPKSIQLPTIKVDGYIQQVGVDQKKAVAVPNNIHLAGWFVDMAIPGEQGLSVIDGHVSGRKNDGIFKDLIKLKKGDQFTVTFGNDSSKSFVVDEVVSVKTEDSASVLFSQKPGTLKQLNLITCGGDFDKTANQYKERVIAIAKAIE